MSDPQQQPSRPPLPPPPQANWYPNQFQYQPQPPPPQPTQSMWPNNHSDHHQPTSYPSPHQLAHAPPNTALPPPQPQSHYYPPPHHPPPYAHSQPYLQPNTHQAWGNPSLSHQVWEHPDRSNPNYNDDDWAAKARAWSAAKSAMESQHQPSQLTHIGRPEEHNRGYHDQYQPTGNPHHANFQQPSLPASSHQQFSVPMGDIHGVPATQLQDSSFSSGLSSYYASDLQTSYASRDGALGADPPVYPHQGNIPMNSSGYVQEVPSSYSSVPGERNRDLLHTSLPISAGYETQQYAQPTAVPVRSAHEEQPYFSYGVGSSGSVTDPSDRPLEFARGFKRNPEARDQHPQSGYVHPDPAGPVGYVDHVSAGSSVSSLTPPVMPGMGYPPSGIQYDPSFVSTAPVFGQMTGPNFPPNIPNVSAAFGVGGGNILQPIPAFPGDFTGVAGVPDKPKKASVPNWLREEIIKNKAVIASSSQEHLEEGPDNPTEDDNIEKSFGKRGPADGRSIDSSRLSDNEDNDEDAIEAARTAAINQEIKRVLTEVLLKVTDDLFDEIATKVLNEDDQAAEVEHNNAVPNQKVQQSHASVPASKASAKVLVPVKMKEAESNGASGKSPSVSAGDLLGLGNYASDDDYDETEGSSKSTKNRFDASPSPMNSTGSEDRHHVAENGKGPSGINIDKDQDKPGLAEAFNNPMAVDKELINNKNQDEETKRSNSCKEVGSWEPSREERHARRERTDDRNGTREKPKDRVTKSEEKIKESDLRKGSHSNDDKTENEKAKKASVKDDNGRRRTRDKDEKEEKSRHHGGRDSSSHRRRHSPSAGSRIRSSKDNSGGSHANESSDETSEDSRRRKKHSRKRSLSPSHIRSKKRQVSRSPHHKHSSSSSSHHRRQSPPYSSLDTKRGRRSRSNSPVRRRR